MGRWDTVAKLQSESLMTKVSISICMEVNKMSLPPRKVRDNPSFTGRCITFEFKASRGTVSRHSGSGIRPVP